ncbi:hypothetical protein ABZ815_37500 [Nonomuraea sp. NPDC047529]
MVRSLRHRSRALALRSARRYPTRRSRSWVAPAQQPFQLALLLLDVRAEA